VGEKVTAFGATPDYIAVADGRTDKNHICGSHSVHQNKYMCRVAFTFNSYSLFIAL
jgi:hypothetical protein